MAVRGTTFTYRGFDLSASGSLVCHYELDAEVFSETINFEIPDGDFTSAAAAAAARLVFLLAGISYYKTGAAKNIAVPSGLSAKERELLTHFYREGLGEFAYVNQLDLSDIEIAAPEIEHERAVAKTVENHPLIPFGGGIDSIVVVAETTRTQPNAALFVANTSTTLFEPIEQTALITGLPILRANRKLDEKVLRSRELNYLNGHVPVTGILSAIAVMTAVVSGRDSVVMSNEHSASEPTALQANGVLVNHQWSKSLEFEVLFREAIFEAIDGVDHYSALRPYSELWVAERFAKLAEYHLVFRSCNRAFYVDPAMRAATWCGECDKCCFIDLILAPFMSAAELDRIFTGREPLNNEKLLDQFKALLGKADQPKPLECVGDEGECRRATLLAAERPDRIENSLLRELVAYINSQDFETPSRSELLTVQGDHFLPNKSVG